jgi:hypothetical protein
MRLPAHEILDVVKDRESGRLALSGTRLPEAFDIRPIREKIK